MTGIKNRVDAARQAEADAKAEAEAKEKAEAEAKAEAKAEAEAKTKTPKAEKDGKANPDAKCKPGDPKHEDDDEDKEDMAAKARADAAAISQLCADAGVPNLAAKLISEGATEAEAKARIEAAADIRGYVARARRFNPAIDPKLADDFIASEASLEHVCKQLMDSLVSMQAEDISNTHGPDSRPAGRAADHGWGDAIAKITPRSRAAK